jgi:hypothetical protein
MQKHKLIQKEKYNISSRFIYHEDVKRMVNYQKELINTVVYLIDMPKKNKIQKINKIWQEIIDLEVFIKKYYHGNYQPIKL